MSELALARTMLADAMDGSTPRKGGFASVEPKPSAHQVSRTPRESGIVNRRRPREGAQTGVVAREGLRRNDTPRVAAGGSFETGDKGPPSSR
jgi:hypothetical protein